MSIQKYSCPGKEIISYALTQSTYLVMSIHIISKKHV